MTKLIVAALWLACSAAAYPIALGSLRAIGADDPHFAAKWCRRDIRASLFLSLSGPAALVFLLTVTNFAEDGVEFTCSSVPQP